MFRSCCSAQIVAAALVSALSGCGSIALFGEYETRESPEVAAAPWPELIDTPPAPPVGTYTAAAPDPAEGVLTQSDLGAAGAEASARAAALAAPIAADQGAAASVESEMAAAAARAAALAGPVISDAERAAMLEAARRSPPLSD